MHYSSSISRKPNFRLVRFYPIHREENNLEKESDISYEDPCLQFPGYRKNYFKMLHNKQHIP